MVARQPRAESILSSHLTLLEEQLLDDREWLFDTELLALQIYLSLLRLRMDSIILEKGTFRRSEVPQVISVDISCHRFFKAEKSRRFRDYFRR